MSFSPIKTAFKIWLPFLNHKIDVSRSPIRSVAFSKVVKYSNLVPRILANGAWALKFSGSNNTHLFYVKNN